MRGKKKKVLIYPAGSEGAINIYNALKYNFHFELFGASMVSNHASFIFDDDHYFEGDLKTTSLHFFDTLNEVIKKFEIDFIICTHDEVVTFLMENRDKVNATICSSPVETVQIACSKKLTSDTFYGKYYMAKIYNSNDNINYPVFLKPYIGAGGKGTKKIDTKEELEYFLKDKKDYLICEFLPGDEYTVDCFTDRLGNLLFCGARTRERVTCGISYRTQRIKDKKIDEIAKDINKTLKFRGAWFFQLKKDINEEYKLMEICVRQAGTMVYYRELGFNFPALTLFDFMEQEVKPIINDYDLILDRCLHNAFKLKYDYQNVYIDFDDTIIVEDKVNPKAMQYLYQCKNLNRNIYLLSKHSTDIYEDLEKYSINKNLFNEIYVIENNSNKIDYINPNKSIFIDNYFIERYEVNQKLGIPVFDVDAIECLIDDSKI